MSNSFFLEFCSELMDIIKGINTKKLLFIISMKNKDIKPKFAEVSNKGNCN